MSEVERQTSIRNDAVHALVLAVIACAVSVACLFYLGLELFLSYGRGPDWSRSWHTGLGKALAWFVVLGLIAVLSIASLRAAWRTDGHLIATTFTVLLAGLSAVFSIGALCFLGYVAVASIFMPEHPNRSLFALHDAACKADREGVKRALARGVSATARWTDISPGDGGDALAAYFKCYKSGQPFDQELVEMLLSAGSLIKSRPDVYPGPVEVVLTSAPQGDQIPAVKYLVSKGLSPNGGATSSGRPLAIAAARGHTDLLKALLLLGATTDSAYLADHLFTGDRRFCSDWKRLPQIDAPYDDAGQLAAADILIENGLKITPAALEKGRMFCSGAQNRMVTHVESRLNTKRPEIIRQ